MSAREDILASVRRNRPAPALAQAALLPEVPAFSGPPGSDLVAEFGRRLAQMGGKLVQPEPGEDPLVPARAMVAGARAVWSMIPDLPGNRAVAGTIPASLHDIDLAVLRARFAVAETGSVALLAADLGVNAVGYLAQRLLILLDPADIVANLHSAYARPEFHEGHYLVLQTGPSATADIEGVLIHGAQGVRALTVLLTPRRD